MVKVEGYGHIECGCLILDNRKKFEAEIGECQNCQVIITVKKRGKRSSAQNSYYHAVVVETVRHRLIQLGHRITHEECHEELKRRFLAQPLADEHGTIIFEKGGSTTELNKTEFSDLIERIREWCLDMLGIDIPPADKSLTMEF
jgi:hypothetical protein